LITLIATIATTAALLAQAVGGLGAPRDLAGGSDAKAPAYSALRAAGHCQGGGRVTLTVTKLETAYHVQAELRGVAAGRWRGTIEENSGTRPYRMDQVDFTVRTHDGRVSVEGEVRHLPQPDFMLVAFGPGRLDPEKGRHCISSVTGDPLIAVGGCRSKGSKLAVVQTFRRDGGSVVRWAVGPVAKRSTWSFQLAAETDGEGAAVGASVTPGRQGFLRGKEFFEGMANPRVELVARSKRGQICTVRASRTLAPPAG